MYLSDILNVPMAFSTAFYLLAERYLPDFNVMGYITAYFTFCPVKANRFTPVKCTVIRLKNAILSGVCNN